MNTYFKNRNKYIFLFLLTAVLIVETSCNKKTEPETPAVNSHNCDESNSQVNIDNENYSLVGVWINQADSRDSIQITENEILTNKLLYIIPIDDEDNFNVYRMFYYSFNNNELKMSESDNYSKAIHSYKCVNYDLVDNKLSLGDYAFNNGSSAFDLKNKVYVKVK